MKRNGWFRSEHDDLINPMPTGPEAVDRDEEDQAEELINPMPTGPEGA